MTNFHEPCARVDGGINILKNSDVIWESPAIDGNFDWGNPAPNLDINSPEWKSALLLCEVLNLIEKIRS